MTEPRPEITTFALGDFQTNCHIVTVGDESTCWIVDCGYEPDALLDAIDHRKLKPIAIMLTHAHADHIAGIDAALARFGDVPIYLHEAEESWCMNPMLNLSGLAGRPITCRPPTHLLHGGESLELHGTTWTVHHAPGHSPGCVLFVHAPSGQAIVGDTLFKESIGRVDFPTSDPAAMRHTIAEVLMALPDEMAILPGHGPSSTIGVERRTNPFVLHGF
ncbi:MAG: MBL fold metallo-hydrolase [Planctomycetota bacterium]